MENSSVITACHKGEETVGKHVAQAKWAALVDDCGIPMPRRTVSARTIKDQAGVKGDKALVRDFQSHLDVVLKDDDEVDLSQGNVFRTIPACEGGNAPPCQEPAKLAFFVDDECEVTINPRQTGDTLRRLFELSSDLELLRDYESPHDEPIADDEAANFPEGPVFRTQTRTITVTINRHPVKFHRRHVTGLIIKETAIKQGVKLCPDCVLYYLKAGGGVGPAVGDAEKVVLKECDEFRCVTTDDNS